MKNKLLEIGLQEEMATKVINIVNKEINKVKDNYKNEIYSIKLENAIEKAVNKSGAKTEKAVTALLDRDKISLDEKGNITGIEEQLIALKENDDTVYLFNKNDEISFKGVNVGYSGADDKSIENMSYDELCAYLENE